MLLRQLLMAALPQLQLLHAGGAKPLRPAELISSLKVGAKANLLVVEPAPITMLHLSTAGKLPGRATPA